MDRELKNWLIFWGIIVVAALVIPAALAFGDEWSKQRAFDRDQAAKAFERRCPPTQYEKE